MTTQSPYETTTQPELRFAPDFVLGTATAAYQIEGAATSDGRGPSIWDTFSHQAGTTLNGATGDVAVAHYDRLDEDLDLLAWLGLDAYRFSISWPRVLPKGTGSINHAGLDFYQRLVDGLVARGIRPYVTLYHWDLPQSLQDTGGWLERGTASAFADYSALVVRALGDRVDTWTTINEPWCAAFLGYGSGEHAPGIHSQALRAAHHLNLAHGLATQAVRAEAPSTARCSVGLQLFVDHPDTSDTAASKVELVGNETFLGPMFDGVYPDELVELTAATTDWSFVHDRDLVTIHQPQDLLGVNYYTTQRARLEASANPRPDTAWPGADDITFLPPTPPLTDMGWTIDPVGLTTVLTGLSKRYPRQPLLVTENGAAFRDTVDPDGHVHDTDRVQYLADHLAATQAAIREGADVRGYLVWSLMDNFEWTFGYSKRFGIIYVDSNQRRIPKDSAHWLRNFGASRNRQ